MMSMPIEEQGVSPAIHDELIAKETAQKACKIFGHPKFEVDREGLHYCPRCGGPVVRTNDGRGA